MATYNTKKGWQGKVVIKDTTPAQSNSVTYVENFSLTQDNGVEGVFEIGTRAAVELHEGNVKVTGKIVRKFDISYHGGQSDLQHFDEIAGSGSSGALLTQKMYIYPAGYASASLPVIKLETVMFNNYEFNVTEAGYATQSVDFVAEYVAKGVTI